MTDPFSVGGAGLPDPQINPTDPPPPAAVPEVPAEATSAWPPTAVPAEPAGADSGAGFGMPSGEGFGAPAGSPFGSPAGGLPPVQPGALPGAQPEAWTPGPALTASAGRRDGRKRLIIAAIAVVVIGVVAYAAKDRGTSSPLKLQVGDCFDVPTSTSVTDVIDSVQHHPCTESHTGEIYYITPYTGVGADGPYPAQSAFHTFATAACPAAFEAYTGASFDSSPDLNVGWFFPVVDGWTSGDKTIQCYIERTDHTPMTRSVKGIGTASPSATP